MLPLTMKQPGRHCNARESFVLFVNLIYVNKQMLIVCNNTYDKKVRVKLERYFNGVVQL